MDKDYLIGIKEKYSLPILAQHVAQWQSLKVLVVGDTIIDEYCFVEVKGRAMKDPMLSVNFVDKEQYAGGVLAIANHVSNFVKDVTFETRSGELISLVIKDPTLYTKNLNLERTKSDELIIPYSAIIAVGDFVVVSEEDLI